MQVYNFMFQLNKLHFQDKLYKKSAYFKLAHRSGR